jgi:hypothetical protein
MHLQTTSTKRITNDPPPTTPTLSLTSRRYLLAEALTLSLRDAHIVSPFLRDSHPQLFTQGRNMIRTIAHHILCTALMVGCYSGAAATTLYAVDVMNQHLAEVADARIKALTN